MKKWLTIVLVFSIISCKKDNNSSQTTSTFKFKANGTSYEWNGVESDTSIVGTALYHDPSGNHLNTLGATDFRNNGYNKFAFDIMEGDLHTGTFTYHGGTNAPLIGECTLGTVSNNINYWNSTQSDSVSVTVTEVANGFISGTFKGSITRYGGQDKLVITDGQFQHVKIVTD